MTTARKTGLGVPRLQELEFLETGMQAVVAGDTYDEIRRALIDHMQYARRDQELTGNHAGRRPAVRAADTGRYFHNTNECLTELMRLGWVERAALPAKRSALDHYRTSTFRPTPAGIAWAKRLADDDVRGAYDELLVGLWRLHPQLAGIVKVLMRGRFRVPIAGWSEVHGDFIASSRGETAGARRAYMSFLADRCVGAIEAGVTGWDAAREDILEAVVTYIDKLTARAARRDRDAFPRNRDFTQACEEALVSFAFAQVGVRVDFITVEIVRRWLRTLNIASFSYHVPGPPSLTMWATAEVTEDEVGNPVVQRNVGPDFDTRVKEELPAAFARAADHVGSSFVPIHMVRAAVCSSVGAPEAVFERTLRTHLATQVETDASFHIHLDPASFGALPPTERPFVLESRGRPRPFYLMSLINQPAARRAR
jgi:hypothetical protein